MLTKSIWSIIKQSFSDFMENKVLKLSAALAYYTIFSLPAMLIIIITVSNIFYGREAIEGTLYHQIAGFVGADAAAQIQQIIRSAALSNSSYFATIVGVVTLLIGATSVFSEIQDSINSIWRLKSKPKGIGILKFLMNRLLSFSLVVTFAITSLLFGMIFKVLPDARVKWKQVRAGAFTTAALFMIGKFLIGYYIGHSKLSATYGAAGTIIVLLVWVYYSAVILYYGAVFTHVYAAHTGTLIYPNSYAVWVQQIEVESEKSIKEQPEQSRAGSINLFWHFFYPFHLQRIKDKHGPGKYQH